MSTLFQDVRARHNAITGNLGTDAQRGWAVCRPQRNQRRLASEFFCATSADPAMGFTDTTVGWGEFYGNRELAAAPDRHLNWRQPWWRFLLLVAASQIYQKRCGGPILPNKVCCGVLGTAH